jgi:hypothetical protein
VTTHNNTATTPIPATTTTNNNNNNNSSSSSSSNTNTKTVTTITPASINDVYNPAYTYSNDFLYENTQYNAEFSNNSNTIYDADILDSINNNNNNNTHNNASSINTSTINNVNNNNIIYSDHHNKSQVSDLSLPSINITKGQNNQNNDNNKNLIINTANLIQSVTTTNTIQSKQQQQQQQQRYYVQYTNDIILQDISACIEFIKYAHIAVINLQKYTKAIDAALSLAVHEPVIAHRLVVLNIIHFY